VDQGIEVSHQRLCFRGGAFSGFKDLELLLGKGLLLCQLLRELLGRIQKVLQLGLTFIQLFNGGSNAKPGFFKVIDACFGRQQQAADGRELNFF
jgi:hypothetical protein